MERLFSRLRDTFEYKKTYEELENGLSGSKRLGGRSLSNLNSPTRVASKQSRY